MLLTKEYANVFPPPLMRSLLHVEYPKKKSQNVQEKSLILVVLSGHRRSPTMNVRPLDERVSQQHDHKTPSIFVCALYDSM
jgi:hypothetical protein